MTSITISEAAHRTGFSPSALRYYEDSGLVRPDRTANGYRRYSPADVEALHFVARAKRLGLTLDEIHELLPLMADGSCAPVQGRLRDLLDQKLEDAERQTGDLEALTSQLARARSRLHEPTAVGACDADCGCLDDRAHRPPASRSLASRRDPIPVHGSSTETSGAGHPAIACTLEADRMPGRLVEWQEVLARVVGRSAVTDGVRLDLAHGTDVAALAQLALDEQGCCDFFTFDLRIGADGVALTVTGPPDARPVITALFGTAA